MNDVPDWWQAILLFTAAWRTFHLLAYDDIAQPFRRYVTREKEGKVHDFLTCPFCLGFWLVVAWWLAWILFPEGALITATPFALSAGLIGVHHFLSTE